MMNGGGPSGFHNAPVTKSFVAASALLTVVIGMRHPPPPPPLPIGLSYKDIFQELRLWDLVASVFAFSSTPELMFGLYLLYYFRVFERQIGSNKYSVFMAFSIVMSLSLEVLSLAYLKDPLYTLAPGPYGLTFAAFVPFYFDIPVSSRIRIFRANFSDKSFIYLAGLQLLFSSWKRSIIPGCCGILAGFLYHLSAFGIRKIKFPNALTSFISRLRWPSSTNFSPTLSIGNTSGNRHFPGQMEGNYPPAHYPIPAPPDTSIATLVSMGFDVDSARQALMQARNDINAAATNLLEAQSR